MAKRRRGRKGISLGTVVMLMLTAAVLGGFGMLLPKLTGVTDVRTNAAELAVAIDQSLSQLSQSVITSSPHSASSQATALPPDQLATYVSAATAAPFSATEPPKQSFSFCAAGSIQINANVQKAMKDDTGYLFSTLFGELSGDLNADLSIATLENTVISSEKSSDSNVPVDILSPIRSTGVNALCLGYSGVLNGGMSGLAETKGAILQAGITPYGAYASRQERNALTLIDVKGIRVALLSYQNDLTSAGKKKTTDEERDFFRNSDRAYGRRAGCGGFAVLGQGGCYLPY